MKFPIEIELRLTTEAAKNHIDYDDQDEDSEDEESISALHIEIGRSTQSFKLKSWDDVPESYEPVDEHYLREYRKYLTNKAFN